MSHGATAPVDAMARTSLDDDPAWKGSELTAACFFDGIYDSAAFDDLMGTGGANGAPCTFPVPHTRVVGRYYASGPLAHSCSNGKCACDPSHSPEMDLDTITGIPASAFAITHWKLIECGSALAACTADIAPGAPIQSLCGNLNQDGHTCAFESMPSDSHLTCSGAHVGLDRCRTFFESL